MKNKAKELTQAERDERTFARIWKQRNRNLARAMRIVNAKRAAVQS